MDLVSRLIRVAVILSSCGLCFGLLARIIGPKSGGRTLIVGCVVVELLLLGQSLGFVLSVVSLVRPFLVCGCFRSLG
ncbi:hypothetical protein BJV77DRAFT_985381 [Russula vinacea]|nr:hypothetical protein BJV77DRAFT_985381 [Russula vinacea]